ncbi:MAG: hypothetical protein ABEJ79_03350 [Halolamina sp.]
MATDPTRPAATSDDGVTTVRVERPMNDHGAVAVAVTATGELRHLVAHETRAVAATLAAADAGDTVALRMERAGRRGNVWRSLPPATLGRSTARDATEREGDGEPVSFSPASDNRRV